MITAKIIILVIALLINCRNTRMIILTAVIGIDVFLPIPETSGRAVWCIDCIFVDAITALAVMMVNAETSFALFVTCITLVIIHLVYLQAGAVHFPEYKMLLPSLECVMLMFCVIGGIMDNRPENRITNFLKKYMSWLFFSIQFN